MTGAAITRQRWATRAIAASLLWHFLDGPDDRMALCGEFHRDWQPVERFAVPDAFEPCQMCVAINDGMVLDANCLEVSD